jgi:F-type H+-transporting ATPase subunit gamma
LPTLKDIRNRIKSVKDVEQITKAMKMVAAARLRKTESRLMFARNGLNHLEQILAGIFSLYPEMKTSLMEERPVKKTGVLILTGDRGLCGGFNSNVVRKFLRTVEPEGKEKFGIFGIGKKGNVQLKRSGLSMLMEKNDLFTDLSFQKAAALFQSILGFYQNREIDNVKAVFTRFKSRGEETIPVVELLPFRASLLKKTQTKKDYLFEPDKELVLDSILVYYLQMKVYTMLLESETAEFFARMTAMDAASNNATELIRTLRLDFNRARQAAITKELIDIVGTAEALK